MAKRWIIAACAVPVVGVAAIAAAALAFDPNSQKARITDAVHRATGRELTLAGPVRLGWSLTPSLQAEDVAFANMAGGSRPTMATAARVEARVKLWPLLSGRVELARLTLIRPDILIETDRNGRGNWQFDRAAAAPGDGLASPSARRATVAPDYVEVVGGRLTWRDGLTGRVIAADVAHATLEGGDGPLHLVVEATSAGAPVKLDGTMGSFAQLTGATSGSFPVALAATLGDTTLSLNGAADPAARTLSGRVEASVPDLARLGVLVQHPDWPPLHDMRLAATLPAAGGLPQDVSLQLGAADLGRVVPGATLARLALTWPAGQPARLEADGLLAGAPWRLATGLVPTGGGAALRGFSISSAMGDMAGDVAVIAQPRLALRGTLVSNRLDLDAARAAPARPTAPASPPPPGPPVPPGRIFSDVTLPWSVLRVADANVQLSIAVARFAGTDFRDIRGHIVLQDGVLRVDPASLQAPEGRVYFSASADANQPAPPVALALRSAAFALDPLAQAFGLPAGSDGSAELDVALHAAGTTPHDLAASLEGHVGIALVDGEVANAALAAALGSVLRMAGTRLDPNGRSHVRCLAVRADMRAGQVNLTALKLDTARLLLDGGGTLNLADETMALRLRPLLRLAGTGVSAPIRLDGALRHPVAALDAPGGTGRVGVVIGGLGGPAEACTAELTAARDGRVGALPAEAAASRSGKPADLLRSFLR